jgi:predicted phosphodiesterase
VKISFQKCFISSLLFLVLCTSLFVSCDDVTNNSDDTTYDSDDTTSEIGDIIDLTLQLGSDDTSMNFCWFNEDTDATDAIVQIALTSEMTDDTFPKDSASEYSGTYSEVEISDESSSKSDSTEYYLSCEVSATDLISNTEYMYRVGDGTTFSDTYTFTTGNTDSFSFILVGDPQIGADDVDTDSEGWETTVTAANTATDADFIVSMGDQVNSSTSEEEYAAFFSAEELTSLPFVSCIGNHDTDELYQYHFNTPNESENYGLTDDVGGDYWFTYGDVLFMVLNTNNTSTTTHEYFVEEAIEEAGDSTTWRFVIFHHSIYSTGSHAEDDDILTRREYLSDVFEDNDVDVVFMGHDHVYCRSYQLEDDVVQTTTTETIDGVDYVENPEGVLYLTLNSSSGSKYYDLLDTWTYDNTYRACYDQSYEPNYSHVEVTDTTFTVTTYSVDDDDVVDTYSIYKSEDNS